MQLIYLIDIFEDNFNIARNRFETDFLKVKKNRPPCCKETKEISIYTSLDQSIKKP